MPTENPTILYANRFENQKIHKGDVFVVAETKPAKILKRKHNGRTIVNLGHVVLRRIPTE